MNYEATKIKPYIAQFCLPAFVEIVQLQARRENTSVAIFLVFC
jgi:hypothetical protein